MARNELEFAAFAVYEKLVDEIEISRSRVEPHVYNEMLKVADNVRDFIVRITGNKEIPVLPEPIPEEL